MKMSKTKSRKVFFCSDLNKEVIQEGMRKHGWTSASPRESWNIYWTNLINCKQFFNRTAHRILNDNQLINHFPNSYVLTRKDFLPRIIRKYQNELVRNNKAESSKDNISNQKVSTDNAVSDIMPLTFVLPEDYASFIMRYDKHENYTWIMKPCCSSKGSGIFLSKGLSKVKKWKKSFRKTPIQSTNKDMPEMADNSRYVISKYIENPLIIGGKKFDLRFYVLVLSYRPLKVYMFKEGFCRFCTNTYCTTSRTLNNPYVHLTNVAVQRKCKKYNKFHGGKWSISNFRLYLESIKGSAITDKLFEQIKLLIVHSLKAVQPVIISDRHCFECYGYDIIIDCHLKPWLIEVNSSPSLAFTSHNDKLLKLRLIQGIFSLIVPPNGYPDVWWNKTPRRVHKLGFERLIDEELASAEDSKQIKQGDQ